MLAVLFLNHDSVKIQVDNPTILNLSLFFGLAFLTLITLRKTVSERPLSILQTNQMKGVAIIIIIITHLSYHTLENHVNFANSIFSGNAGFVSVALFLILSGFGLSISLEKKGIKNFFSKRFIKIYIPVLLAMLLEVSLIHILLPTNNNLLFDLARIFYDLASVDRNLWFIVFIMFWYCIVYLVFWLKISKTRKVIFLFYVSLIVLSFPAVSEAWKINAFSFPIGCWLGLNSKLITEKVRNILNLNIVIVLIIPVLFNLLFKLTNSLSYKPFLKGSTLGAALVFSVFAIGCLIYILKRKIEFENTIENIFLFSAVILVYLNCSEWFFDRSTAAYIFRSLSAIFGATSIFFLISLLVKFNFYSYFLSFIGEISFELYLIHGMFMYSFDFVLFRGNIAVTFFIYFLGICLASLAFGKLNSLVYDSLIRKLER